MILTILILLGIGLALYSCVTHGLCFLVGVLLAVGYTLALILVFLLLVALLSVFIRIDRPADRRTRFYHWLMTNIVEVGMFLLRVRMNVTGREKIPRDTRFLLVCNHRTIFDPVLTMAELSEFTLAFISKKENFKIPIVNKLMHMCFCLPLDRNDNRAAVRTINEAVELLDDNVVSMGIYPEGATNKTEEPLMPFRNGAFKIAQKAKVPIVVCVIENTEKILKNFPWQPTTVNLKVLEVLPYDSEHRGTRDVSEHVWPLMYHELVKTYPGDGTPHQHADPPRPGGTSRITIKTSPGRIDRGIAVMGEKSALDAVDQFQKLGLGPEADGPAGQGAVLAEDKGGDGIDGKLGSQARLLIHIYLAELDAGYLGGQLIDDGGKHPAGAAPRRPEVDADGQGRGDDLLFKIVGVQLNNICRHFITSFLILLGFGFLYYTTLV